jgi:nucleoside-diphosphate-sugar epimerase
MRTLVLGGSGFIGSFLVPELLGSGHSVTLANRGRTPIPGTEQLVIDRNQPWPGHTTRKTYDVVIDTSGYNGPQVTYARSAMRGRVGRWIHVSSGATYKETPGRAPSESDPIGGARIWGSYGIEKSDADAFLLNCRDGIPTVILRPPYLYGPRNDNDRETFVFARALTGRPVVVPGRGDTALQFLHAGDLAAQFVISAQSSSTGTEVFNVAGPEVVTALEWVNMLAEITETSIEVLFGEKIAPDLPPRSYFPFRDAPCILDIGKYQAQEFGGPTRPMKQGFQATFASYPRSDLLRMSPATDAEITILTASWSARAEH